jgi:hypothetical protein
MPLFGRPSEKDDAREAAYRQWFARQHPLALASLLLSLFSLTHFGTLIVDEVIGVAFGVVALVQINASAAGDQTSHPPREGKWLARGGIGVGLISFACAMVIYFVFKPRH